MEFSLWGIMYFLFNIPLNELNFPLWLRNVISENAERRKFSPFIHYGTSPCTLGVRCEANAPESMHCFWRSTGSLEGCLSFFPPVKWELGSEMILCSRCLKPLWGRCTPLPQGSTMTTSFLGFHSKLRWLLSYPICFHRDSCSYPPGGPRHC